MGYAILLALAALACGSLVAAPSFGVLANLPGAGLFGLVLAGYLWLHAGVRSGARLLTVFLAAIIAHYVMMFIVLASVLVLMMMREHVQPDHALMTAAGGAAGAALLAAVFLRVLPSGRDRFRLEIACCAIAGALCGFLWEFAVFAPVRWVAGMPVWNGAVAGALGFAAHLRSRPAATRTRTLRVVTGTGVAAVCVLLVFGDQLRAAVTPAPVVRLVEPPTAAIDREARIKSLNEAPPAIDLAPIPSVPPADMFTRKPITGWACYPPHDDRLSPDTREVESRQLRLPARHQYHLQCYPKNEDPNRSPDVHVSIVQYPNDAWARYDLRNQDGYQGVISDRRSVTRILIHGRPIFASKRGWTYWTSSDKFIGINGSASQEVLDRFIDAYLKRYPSTLEPDFDLPYLPGA